MILKLYVHNRNRICAKFSLLLKNSNRKNDNVQMINYVFSWFFFKTKDFYLNRSVWKTNTITLSHFYLLYK